MKSPTSAFDERILLVDRVSHAKRLTCAKRRVAETMTNPHEDVRLGDLSITDELRYEEARSGERPGRANLVQFELNGGQNIGKSRFPLKKSHLIPLRKDSSEELE